MGRGKLGISKNEIQKLAAGNSYQQTFSITKLISDT